MRASERSLPMNWSAEHRLGAKPSPRRYAPGRRPALQSAGSGSPCAIAESSRLPRNERDGLQSMVPFACCRASDNKPPRVSNPPKTGGWCILQSSVGRAYSRAGSSVASPHQTVPLPKTGAWCMGGGTRFIAEARRDRNADSSETHPPLHLRVSAIKGRAPPPRLSQSPVFLNARRFSCSKGLWCG
jgi:hypothetical protein